MIFGIKLGSSLIELGFIDEENLSHCLSRKLGVPSVGKHVLMSIPSEVLEKVPAALAEKHRVIPIRIESRRIAVAMVDPADLQAIDELAFATGLTVEPHIAPDLLVSFALERHYDVKRDMRYVRVSGQRYGLARVKTEQQNFKTPTKPNEMTAPVTETKDSAVSKSAVGLLNIEFPTEFEGFGSLPDLPEKEPAINNYSIDKLSMDFASAGTRDDVADVFIKYLGQEFSSGAIMIVRGKSAVGWRAVQDRDKITDFDKLTIVLDASSVLYTVIATSHFHMGPLNNSPGNKQLTGALKSSPERSHLIMPVIMLNKVVAVVIVLAEMDALGTRLLELQKLVYKASLAFEMLIIKNKILMT
ncbi:MAG: general secretion pathway protein GspE [Desulfuromonadaceae bacterium]